MLTFEAIRELERNEKSGKKLQKMPENMTDEIAQYLAKKEGIAEKTSSDIMEIENVKSVIKRFYELRERKITEYALDTVRTGMPPHNMLPFEEHTFWQMVELLKTQREMYFTALKKTAEESEKKQNNIASFSGQAAEKPVEKEKSKMEEKISELEEPKTYRIIKTLPPFVGLDLQVYELKEGEIKEIPEPLNELLLKEGVIEEVKK